MFCPKCGNELPEGAAFCNACGASVEKKAPEAKPAVEPVEAIEKKSGAGFSVKPIVIGVVAAVVVLVVVLVVAVGSCSSSNAGNGASGDSASSAQSKAPVENLPVPDFSKIINHKIKDVEEYLAEYPKDKNDESKCASSKTVLDMGGLEWKYDEDLGAGAWELRLEYSDDAQTCESVSFHMTPLSSYEDDLASSEAYAAMIQGYLSDCDIHEMTIAIMDRSSNPGDIKNRYEGYILFDDFAADVGDYSITIYPKSGDFDWEKVKARIAKGEYRDVHSGGITYTYPYVDVYTTSSNSGSATDASSSASSGTSPSKAASSDAASSASGSAAMHDEVTGKAFCSGKGAPDAVKSVSISDDEIVIDGWLNVDGLGKTEKKWSFGINENTQFGGVSGQGFKEYPKDEIIPHWEAREFPTLVLELENGMAKRVYQSS